MKHITVMTSKGLLTCGEDDWVSVQYFLSAMGITWSKA